MFRLDWKFANPKAVIITVRAIKIWLRRNRNNHKDYRVRDMVSETYPHFYASLTRGDKCRVGLAFSYMYNRGWFPALSRGKKKGATNTYHMK